MEISQRIAGFNGDFLVKDGVAVGKAVDPNEPILEWITASSAVTIQALEEYVNGVPTNVLGLHNLTAGQVLPSNYILKSYYKGGFCRVRITGGNANAFILSPDRARNNKDSVNSGIYKAG
jgi:hypothetical protein